MNRFLRFAVGWVGSHGTANEPSMVDATDAMSRLLVQSVSAYVIDREGVMLYWDVGAERAKGHPRRRSSAGTTTSSSRRPTATWAGQVPRPPRRPRARRGLEAPRGRHGLLGQRDDRRCPRRGGTPGGLRQDHPAGGAVLREVARRVEGSRATMATPGGSSGTSSPSCDRRGDATAWTPCASRGRSSRASGGRSTSAARRFRWVRASASPARPATAPTPRPRCRTPTPPFTAPSGPVGTTSHPTNPLEPDRRSEARPRGIREAAEPACGRSEPEALSGSRSGHLEGWAP